MAGTVNSILDLVGNTPMVALRRIAQGSRCPIVAKQEGLNPTGSVKDRVALAMVLEAEKKGLLPEGATIVEATSGNMGLALAMVASVKGYQLDLYMPENAPIDRRKLLSRCGVQIQLTPSVLGMEGAQQAARESVNSKPGRVSLDMFQNPSVVRVHREVTAWEILEATGGDICAFVAGVGTAGTITGVGGRLKQHDPSIRVVAVEPAWSQVIGRGVPGHHAIHGIGADFVPPLLNLGIIDQIIAVTDTEASQMTSRLGAEEGLLVGISSGANVAAALRLAREMASQKPVVTVLPDRGDWYADLPA